MSDKRHLVIALEPFTQKNKAWTYVDVTNIASRPTLAQSVCDGLIRMRAFSGCDSTGRFAGRGEKPLRNYLLKNYYFATQ